MRLVMADLFCKAGGASKGYADAGFEVVGVDIEPQPRYPFEFIQADALTVSLEGYDAIHASPPCQDESRQLKHRVRNHPGKLILPTRARLVAAGVPYIIENVRGSILNGPILCGSALGMSIYKHRIFETNWPLMVPPCQHDRRNPPLNPYNTKSKHRDGISGLTDPRYKAAMGIDWMTGDEISNAIPPAYTEYIGRALLRCVERGWTW